MAQTQGLKRMIDVVMCLKQPPFWLLERAIARIRAQPETQRILFVIHPTLDLIDFVQEQMQEGDECLWDMHGLAYARWLGIRASTAEYVSFVDHDVLLPPHYYATCLPYLQNGMVGAVNGISVDPTFPLLGLKTHPPAQLKVLPRGLCTATLLKREAITDWYPPKNLHACEDLHLTRHLKAKGYDWLQIPQYVFHYSTTNDVVHRWRWHGAGYRMLFKPRYFLARRGLELLKLPYFYRKYGARAEALWHELRHQWHLTYGFLHARDFLKSHRRAYT